uniref:mis18-binding protein 1 isoform X2 n=1 Tax=Monopterus albus TaxID=43700 RepID=UPI0009B44041|nr:mis18-binding protein 1 isoform X2 [Monopterus albus]
MASYKHLLQHAKPKHESPAKVFAKLKSKVQREAMCVKEDVFTDNDSPCKGGEKHGAPFNSQRNRAKHFCVTDEHKENHRFASCNVTSEVRALTLSPISSPRKTGYSLSDIRSKHATETPPVTERIHGVMSRNEHTPTKKAFLESAAVSHHLSQVNREQLHPEPPQIRDMYAFSRAPTKSQLAEDDCVRTEEECASPNKLMSPAKLYTPIKNRLRKRTWEQQEFDKVSNSTKVVSTEHTNQQQQRNNTHSTCMDDDLGDVRGFPVDGSEMTQFTHEPMSPPPRSVAENRCFVVLERPPPMSLAKMFAFMKEREHKREQHKVDQVSSSTRERFDGGNCPKHRDRQLSTAHNKSELPDSHSRLEPPDSPSVPSEDVPIPAVPSQPVLYEDPLLLNSPEISIPKKHEPVFTRNKLSQCAKFPNENVIYLKKWYLRKSSKGLFVDGIHSEKNIPWKTNLVAERVSNYVVKTVSGTVYVLVGKMNLHVQSDFSKWFLRRFAYGFPVNWKSLYEKFLSESRDTSRKTERNRDRGTIKARTKSEASSINLSVTQHRQKPFKTPDTCPPAFPATKVSRSGRVIKPPLEYWKGGRVILDAHMNVTIHECYNTSTCIPEVNTTVSARMSQKPVCVFLPCSEDRKQYESASEEEASVPVRKVKASLRRCNKVKAIPKEESSNSPEPAVETISSSQEWSGRTMHSRMHPASERMLYVDTVPQKQREPKKSSAKKSKKQAHVKERRQTVVASPESLTVNDKSLQQESSDDEFFINRAKQRKSEFRMRRGEILNKSQIRQVSPSSQSSESSEKNVKGWSKRTREAKNIDAAQTQRKSSKTSSSITLLPKSPQSSLKRKPINTRTVATQEQKKDKRTEAELMKLQEAVPYNLKSMTDYRAKGAEMVGTHSAEECLTSRGTSETTAKKTKKSKKEKVEAPKDPVPLISAGVGTLKRKQQIPSMCPSESPGFTLSAEEDSPVTPLSKVFPEAKTPQCLAITPGMMGSPNRNNGDKMVFQLQKRTKQRRFNVCKPYKPAPSSKSFGPTPSIKREMRRCVNTENDTFVVWEMFQDDDRQLSDSEEEEDFYFTHDD